MKRKGGNGESKEKSRKNDENTDENRRTWDVELGEREREPNKAKGGLSHTGSGTRKKGKEWETRFYHR